MNDNRVSAAPHRLNAILLLSAAVPIAAAFVALSGTPRPTTTTIAAPTTNATFSVARDNASGTHNHPECRVSASVSELGSLKWPLCAGD